MELIDFLFADEQLFITITLILLIALLIGSVVTDKLKKYTDVDTSAAVTLMDNYLTILDVRDDKERKKGHISGDVHIPLADIKNKLDSLDKNKKILVYCRNGNKSSHASGLLTRNQFKNIYNLKGGFQAWEKAKLPIKT